MTEKDLVVKESIFKRIDDSIVDFKNNKIKMFEKIQKQFQIQLDSEIIEEMVKKTIFKKFIGEVEADLSEFVNERKIKVSNRIFFKKDWEIYDFIRIVLFLKFDEMQSFEEELKVWDEIIFFLEEKIQKLIDNTSGSEKEELFELFNRFRILLDLS